MPDLRAQAELLRSLHRRGDPLVLPNAWDAASAQAVELAAGPPISRLAALGVARVSFGGRLAQLSRVDHERRLAAIRAGEPV